MTRKNKIVIIVLAIGLVVGSIYLVNRDTDKAQDNDTNTQVEIPKYKPAKTEDDAINTVKKLFGVLYFGEGNYKDYKALFTNPEDAMNEEKFNEYRKNVKVEEEFKYGSESIDSLIKHIRVEKNDKNIKLYYMKDVNDEQEKLDARQWRLVEKDGKTLIRNDGLE